MAVLSKNRHTALIFTIFLTAVLWQGALAAPIEGSSTPKPGGGGDGNGDPDVPTGNTRSSFVGRQQVAPAQPMVARPVGDGPSAAQIVWTWRLRIVLQGLRAYWFRF